MKKATFPTHRQPYTGEPLVRVALLTICGFVSLYASTLAPQLFKLIKFILAIMLHFPGLLLKSSDDRSVHLICHAHHKQREEDIIVFLFFSAVAIQKWA